MYCKRLLIRWTRKWQKKVHDCCWGNIGDATKHPLTNYTTYEPGGSMPHSQGLSNHLYYEYKNYPSRIPSISWNISFVLCISSQIIIIIIIIIIITIIIIIIILMRIFGPKRDKNGEWRRLDNEELHSLYRSPNTDRVIKSRRLSCAGDVARMEDGWSAFKC